MADNQNCENGQVASVTEDKGVAPIKPQYLTTKDEFHAFVDAGSKDGESLADAGQACSATDDQASDSVSQEPAAKKIKLDDAAAGDLKEQGEKKRARGQNKSRPHVKYSNYEPQRLCPSITQENVSKCFFGEKCKFLHDIEKYLAEKHEDISTKCHLYETFGKCIYGLSCRFAKSHLGDGFKNLVNEERVKQWEGKVLVRNSMDKDLQRRLRRKEVRFEKTEKVLKMLNERRKLKKDDGAASLPAEPLPATSLPAAPLPATSLPAEPRPADPLPAEPPGGVTEGGGSDKSDCGETVALSSTDITDEGDAGTPVVTCGAVTDEDVIRLRPCEKKKIDFRNKLYLAPLTTCGNLPYRRICKRFGADITCGEMAMCTNILKGHPSEWALLKRHHTEDLFGVQIEGAFPDTMTRCAELLSKNVDVDFVDINVGCPIDLVYKKGGGCGLMSRPAKFEDIVRGMSSVLDVPVTVKIRTGVQEKVSLAHKLIPDLKEWGVSLITLHGRSREQRYTKLADWDYIGQCAKIADPVPLFGNGDIFSYEDANRAMQTGVSGIMLARGALVKPWLFTEIKEQRHWDISSAERFDILREYTDFGLEHWGSDTPGVEKTRRFMLEWLSFLCRYIPVGLLERVPQKINERPPYYMGRDYMETLLASQNVGDWIKISEMLLGPVPPNFTFLPKHKANSYK